MRRIVLLLAVSCLLVPATSSAQLVSFEKGIRVGLNMARMEGDVADAFEDFFGSELESRVAMQAGGWIAWKFAPMAAVQAELLWTQKGSHAEIDALGISADVTYVLDYVELPILMRFDLPGAGVRPRIFLGPAIGLPVTTKVRVDQQGFGEEEEELDDVDTEVSGIVGAGLAFPAGVTTLGIDLRYQLGFTEIASDTDTKNHVFSASVSLGF